MYRTFRPGAGARWQLVGGVPCHPSGGWNVPPGQGNWRSLRPGWEILYNHYAKIKGISSGYTYSQMAAEKLRPEAGAGDTGRYGDNSGAFDQLGWGTLMLYRE